MERIPLRVFGLSYAQLKNSAYMLILQQVNGPYHLNMWIGEAEAHSIAIAMENIHPPRPLTHDLFTSFIHAFGVKLKDVLIYKVDNEIYSSELTFTDGERTVKLDSRTSDGIAIAMRTGAPIYTTREIIDEKGFLFDLSAVKHDAGEGDDDDKDNEEVDIDQLLGERGLEDEQDSDTSYIPRLEQYSIEELERTLQRLIDAENYEEAARVNEILQRKRGK